MVPPAVLMLHSFVWQKSATYSQSLLQGVELEPFVLTNVMTCKLFLARKSSLRDLIFGRVNQLEHTRVRTCLHPLSQATRC